MSKKSYVVFGIPPHKRATNLNDPEGMSALSGIRKDKLRVSDWVRSPYNTPIINVFKLR